MEHLTQSTVLQSFRTLYVEVYRQIERMYVFWGFSFRTLYVEVYQIIAEPVVKISGVSVHYMLRFISGTATYL